MKYAIAVLAFIAFVVPSLAKQETCRGCGKDGWGGGPKIENHPRGWAKPGGKPFVPSR